VRESLSLSLLLLLAIGVAACQTSASADHPIVAEKQFTACAGCHMADYQGAREHPGVKPTTCGVCHLQESWHPQWLEHPWALTGKHVGLDCFKCHTGSPAVFEGTPKECVGCHRAEYDRTPGHKERFPVTCDECHSTFVWKTAYWVDTWTPDVGTAASETSGASEPSDAGAPAPPADAAPPVDAGAAKPKPRWVPPTKPTTTSVPPKPTTTKPPDVVTHPSPRR
jgi:hypothetical protein